MNFDLAVKNTFENYKLIKGIKCANKKHKNYVRLNFITINPHIIFRILLKFKNKRGY